MEVSRAKVESALRAEARKFDRKHRGIHEFKPIWPTDGERGCNWTTGFEVRGSGLALDEMRAALERVQAKMPAVNFDRGSGGKGGRARA
jgi:hypothetical protein